MSKEKTEDEEIIGYKCTRCRRKFLYTNYRNQSEAFKDAYKHGREAHSTTSIITSIADSDK